VLRASRVANSLRDAVGSLSALTLLCSLVLCVSRAGNKRASKRSSRKQWFVAGEGGRACARLLCLSARCIIQARFAHLLCCAAPLCLSFSSQHDISLVLSELQRLRCELSSKSLQRARAAHLRKLDRVLSGQAAVGGLLRPLLPRFIEQHERLTSAVHSAQHRVALEGVAIGSTTTASGAGAAYGASSRAPSVATQSAELDALLRSSAAALSSLGALSRSHLPAYSGLSSASAGLSLVVAEEAAELAEVSQALSRALALEAQTRALRSTHMQQGKIARMREEVTADPDTVRDRSVFRY